MKKGFSLIELLIVIAIMGILAAMGTALQQRAVQRARIQSATAQLAADLERARSSAQKSNTSASLSVASTTAHSYSLTLNGQATTIDLPSQTQVQVAAPLSITYTAPFGEVATTAMFTVRAVGSSLPPLYVKVIGVTGKVVQSANP